MITLTVDGMTCSGCVRSVTKAANSVDSAAEVVVSLETGRVDIRSARPPEAFVMAVRSAGFDVRAA